MTTKAAFSPSEWQLVLEGPPAAGLLVIKVLEQLPAVVPPLADIKDRVSAVVKRQKAEAVALERMKRGGFISRSLLDDALTIAIIESGVALRAFDADCAQGRLGIRQTEPGEALEAALALARNLAWEFGPDNVRVNCIAPGLIKTDFAKALWDDPINRKDWDDRAPMGRAGEPDEIAGAAVFLASKASSFMSGQVIVIDGGMTVT